MRATEGQELFFVEHHLFAGHAVDGVGLHQEDRFFGADFLAQAAVDASEHVDLKFFWAFFNVACAGQAVGSGRGDADGFGRADKLAKLA